LVVIKLVVSIKIVPQATTVAGEIFLVVPKRVCGTRRHKKMEMACVPPIHTENSQTLSTNTSLARLVREKIIKKERIQCVLKAETRCRRGAVHP